MPLYRAVVTIKSPVLGGTGTNTWHLRTDVTPGPDAGETPLVLDALRQFYQTNIGIYCYQTVIGFDGELVGVGPDEETYGRAAPWSLEVQSGGGALPPATAICVNWRGQNGDRSRRGRTFLGPLVKAAAQDDGTIAPGTLSDIRGAAQALVETSDSVANGALGVWSRQEGVFRDFVASSVRDQFAVLRSRRD